MRSGHTLNAARLAARHAVKHVLVLLTHAVGRTTRRFYFEDFHRVYPEGVSYNRLGLRRPARAQHINNFRNHVKFYEFAAQFAASQRVVDVGCGSGYGCKILRKGGAAEVHGTDVSRHALRVARKHFSTYASFTRQGITDLHGYYDGFADVVVCSEVLEHIKEYGLENRALGELRRVTRPGGLLVLATPNSELLGEHGFSWDELSTLVASHFDDFCIFENALVPSEPSARRAWEERVASGRTGIIVSEKIALEETRFTDGVSPETAELKRGLPAGKLHFAGRTVDTTRLHNTHSWAVLAVAH
jgi:2-polyprenyl-3-methyl-5-hydroxy-6-metoxy-1,4-benzoquinol methylase